MEHCQAHVETRELLKGNMESTKSAHHRIDKIEKTLDCHEEQLNKLTVTGAGLNERLDNLVERLDRLISTTKWFIGIGITIILAVLGFTLNIIIK